MPQKIKIPGEEKIRLITSYLAGKCGYYEAVKITGVSGITFSCWVHQYKSNLFVRPEICPRTSFRFHLTMDTLVLGYALPTTRTC